LTVSDQVEGKELSAVTVDGTEGTGTISVSLVASREGNYTAGTFSDRLTFTAQLTPRTQLTEQTEPQG